MTEETEEEQFHRYNTDPIYRNVANHLADTYLTIKTNTSFQIEQEALNIRVRNIIEGK
ncbi:hypothetical protein BAXH7_01371 [Bacillus amyloliquefaciens XH7]|nr:hypothetical protein BAXH7_01371 [Bacillus amyloliquefaciens XH7]